MLESRFCDALRGRVHVYMARYTNDEEVGRIWLVLDKQQIFSAGDISSPNRPVWFIKNGCVYFNSSWGCSHQEMFLLPYLNMSIEEALSSPHEVVKVLAMFDKRVGKRRLQALGAGVETEPLLVRHFYALRCRAEKVSYWDQVDKKADNSQAASL